MNTPIATQNIIVRQLGQQDYLSIWHAMQHFTDRRDEHDLDELWLVEHNPVFTQGQAGKEQHLLAPGDIPVVKVDRGGQVTYHGPGQLMLYVLLNIKRRKLGVRQLVTELENSIVNLLTPYKIQAYPKADAPGVYVEQQKVCSIGLRIRKGCSFHGLALNVSMDLTPFKRINPCGYAGLSMTDCKTLNGPQNMDEAATKLVEQFCQQLSITQIDFREGFDE